MPATSPWVASRVAGSHFWQVSRAGVPMTYHVENGKRLTQETAAALAARMNAAHGVRPAPDAEVPHAG